VTRFAKETGDVHSLSLVDMKLLALAHTLEVAAHGAAHLRTQATAPKMAPKHKTRTRGLPGWGTVPNPEDWAAVDAVPDVEHSGTVAGSRIAQHAQALQLEGGLAGEEGEEQGAEQDGEEGSEGEKGSEGEGDDGWQVAARTSNVRRRKWVARPAAAAQWPAGRRRQRGAPQGCNACGWPGRCRGAPGLRLAAHVCRHTRLRWRCRLGLGEHARGPASRVACPAGVR
jgi:hypothetical protein